MYILFGEGSPTKKGTLILTSPLEDLGFRAGACGCVRLRTFHRFELDVIHDPNPTSGISLEMTLHVKFDKIWNKAAFGGLGSLRYPSSRRAPVQIGSSDFFLRGHHSPPVWWDKLPRVFYKRLAR